MVSYFLRSFGMVSANAPLTLSNRVPDGRVVVAFYFVMANHFCHAWIEPNCRKCQRICFVFTIFFFCARFAARTVCRCCHRAHIPLSVIELCKLANRKIFTVLRRDHFAEIFFVVVVAILSIGFVLSRRPTADIGQCVWSNCTILSSPLQMVRWRPLCLTPCESSRQYSDEKKSHIKSTPKKVIACELWAWVVVDRRRRLSSYVWASGL